jgi:hypothetical protein
MPRQSLALIAMVAVAIAISACSSSVAAPAETDNPTATATPMEEPSPTGEPVTGDPLPGTHLDACEIVTPADIAAALAIDPSEVAMGELRETPNTLSPRHTDCRYSGDWGGLVVNLTPDDGVNLFNAARKAYADASDRAVSGSDGAFWSADTKRGFFWKGSVTVLLQFSHLTTGSDVGEATVAIGQAVIDRVD